MSTSGTFNFAPGLGEITIYALNQCEIRSAAILQEHMESARMAANMMLGRWSSQGVNLWAVDLQSVALVQGQSTYTVSANTIAMLDSYVSFSSGGTQTNRLITPISRSEYAAYPQPQQQGFPTVYWFDRLLSPTVTIWPVPPDNNSTLNYYRVRQIQDSAFTDGQGVEIPYYWLEAFALGLAYRLAIIWKPEKVALLKPLADEAYMIASTQNVETANMYISPMTAGYFRT